MAEDWIRAAVRTHQRALTHYAYRILGDRERARDVVQETFLKLCRHAREDLEERLVPWLYTTCRHRAIDVRRKEARMQPTAEAVRGLPGKSPNPATTVERDETLGRALRLLATLPEKQREAVRLKFDAGLSYREIAEVVGTSAGNVGTLLHNALKTLRRGLAADIAKGGRGT